MIHPMASDLVLRSLSLAYLTIPSALSICLTINSALYLELSLPLSDALRIFPRYSHYPNMELRLTSISMDLYSFSLRISSASLFAPDSHILASLMVAVILVQNSDLSSSNFFSALCLRELSWLYIIPSVSSLFSYFININHPPPIYLSLSSQNIASPYLLIYWQPAGPFYYNHSSIS